MIENAGKRSLSFRGGRLFFFGREYFKGMGGQLTEDRTREKPDLFWKGEKTSNGSRTDGEESYLKRHTYTQ